MKYDTQQSRSEELEEYVKIQESYFADQLVTKEMQLTELTEKHRQEQED